MKRTLQRLSLATLLAVTVGVVMVTVSAQIPTRLFGTKSADLTTGNPTPITCTQSGNGCFLDVSVGGGSFPTGQTVTVGTGTATATVSGVLTTSTTSACTIANTSETDLWTYTLPAGTLATNGRGVRITAWGTKAANADVKTEKLYFGATSLTLKGDANAAALEWFAEALVLRTGATSQIAHATMSVGATSGLITSSRDVTTPAETLAGAVVLRLTGLNGTAAANDVCFSGAMVEAVGGP